MGAMNRLNGRLHLTVIGIVGVAVKPLSLGRIRCETRQVMEVLLLPLQI